MTRVVVVGSLNMDLVVHGPRLPRPGETLLGGPFTTGPGGKGANQAIAASRLGASVTMIGAVGSDAFAGELRQALAADAVAARLQQVDGASGVALITTEPGGENTIVVAAGANAVLTPAFVAAQADAFQGASWVLLQLEVPLAVVASAVALAHEHGARVLLNAAPAQPLPVQLLQRIDALLVNHSELLQLAGLAPDAEPGPGMQTLRERGPGLVVVTLGARGAVAADAHGQHLQRGFRVEAIDAVGAGDAFAGALAVALGDGRGIDWALRFGCAAGALATTRRGAVPSLPTRADVERFLARQD